MKFVNLHIFVYFFIVSFCFHLSLIAALRIFAAFPYSPMSTATTLTETTLKRCFTLSLHVWNKAAREARLWSVRASAHMLRRIRKRAPFSFLGGAKRTLFDWPLRLRIANSIRCQLGSEIKRLHCLLLVCVCAYCCSAAVKQHSEVITGNRTIHQAMQKWHISPFVAALPLRRDLTACFTC